MSPIRVEPLVQQPQLGGKLKRMERAVPQVELQIGSAIAAKARAILAIADQADLLIATAESCTGGLLASVLTGLPGVSHRFECGFVVYSDEAKIRLLGVDQALLRREGAVSMPVACAMAEQALERFCADVTVAITGFAGPGDEAAEGLVHLAAARNDRPVLHRVHHFGAAGREPVRSRAVAAALDLLQEALTGK